MLVESPPSSLSCASLSSVPDAAGGRDGRALVDGVARPAILVYQIYYTGTNLRLFRATESGR